MDIQPPQPPQPPQPHSQPSNEVRLCDIVINNENTALNVMVSFLTFAQKKGIFSLEESYKIWECIKMFKH